MSELEGYLILVAVLVAYALAIAYLYLTRRLDPNGIFSMYGPALMIKTRRGQAMLDRVGRFRRFWSAVGDLGILFAGIAMATIVILLAAEAALVSRVPASEAPSPQTALGLPGINPIIPLGYGLVALIVGVVLHELFHGVMARAQRIGVKSIGVLWFVVPVGAFVEQDEVEMMAAPRRARNRVVAAGVLANFVLAVIFFAAMAAVVSSSVTPNANGVGVVQVLGGYPAQNASIQTGDILLSLNGTATPNDTDLLNALSATYPGESVPVVYYSHTAGRDVDTTVTLASVADYTHNDSDSTKGFLGVVVTPFTPSELANLIATPWSATSSPLAGVAAWIALPVWGLEPVSGPTAAFYHAAGPLAPIGVGNVWIVVNLLYWLAWMNLLLGLSNALPLWPFDGGLLFKDLVSGAVARLRKGWESWRVERAGAISAAVSSLLVIFLIAWLFVGPRL